MPHHLIYQINLPSGKDYLNWFVVHSIIIAAIPIARHMTKMTTTVEKILRHVDQGPISLTIFHHNSNVMKISFFSHPNTNKVIATIFGTWHDSWAVVACAKFCCDVIISNWIDRAKWNFHHIWIVMEKSLVKWVPELDPVLSVTASRHFSDTLCS